MNTTRERVLGRIALTCLWVLAAEIMLLALYAPHAQLDFGAALGLIVIAMGIGALMGGVGYIALIAYLACVRFGGPRENRQYRYAWQCVLPIGLQIMAGLLFVFAV